MYLLKINKIIL